jgi:hypothetical protein
MISIAFSLRNFFCVFISNTVGSEWVSIFMKVVEIKQIQALHWVRSTRIQLYHLLHELPWLVGYLTGLCQSQSLFWYIHRYAWRWVHHWYACL